MAQEPLAQLQMTVMVIWCVRVRDVGVVRGRGIAYVSSLLSYLLLWRVGSGKGYRLMMRIGASCSTGDDCADDLVCKSGRCAKP